MQIPKIAKFCKNAKNPIFLRFSCRRCCLHHINKIRNMQSAVTTKTEKELTLYPSVYWAQDESQIYLNIAIINAQDPEIDIREKELIFESHGYGSQGIKLYRFQLDFFDLLDTKSSIHKLNDARVEFVLKKKERDWWPRLTARTTKPHWLKIDFNKWKDQDETDSEGEEDDNGMYNTRLKNIMGQSDLAKTLAEQISDQEPMTIDQAVGKIADYRNLYLFIYNLTLFLGYFLIVVQMIHGYILLGTDYFPEVWSSIAPKLKCCVIAQFFEVFHAITGFTKTSPIAAGVQVSGRAFVLFVILSGEERLQDKPFIFYVFCAWSLIEIFRYPYYALSVKKISWSIVTWLRYSMWIPLYPAGLLCESVIIFRSIPYYKETGRYSYFLPNRANFSFDFALFETLFLLFGFIPTVIFLIGHMRRQRAKKLNRNHANKMKKAQ